MAGFLDDYLEIVRTTHARFSWVELGRPGAFVVPPDQKTRFYVCLGGSANLLVDGSTHLTLNEGDVLLQVGQIRLDVRTVDWVGSADLQARVPDTFDQDIAWIRLGGDRKPTRLVVGSLHIEPSVHKLLARHLPPLIQLPSRYGQVPTWAEPLRHYSAFRRFGGGDGGRPVLSRIAEAIFAQIVREHFGDTNFVVETGNAVTHAKVNLAIRLVDQNLAASWTVSKLAEAVGMSRSTFAASFAEVAGEGPIGYLTNARLRRAKRLLGDGSYTVAEIGYMLGYNAPSSFIRAFKRRYGYSPTMARRTGNTETDMPGSPGEDEKGRAVR